MKPNFVEVPIVQRISGVLPLTEIQEAALVLSGRPPPMPIQEITGTDAVPLRWVRGTVSKDGTPGIKQNKRRRK